MAHTSSFQLLTLGEVARDIKFWGFTMERLVKHGRRTVGERIAEIRPETPVQVVYASPLTEEQAKTFDEAKLVFEDLGVTAVAQEDLARVADRARRNLQLEGISLDTVGG